MSSFHPSFERKETRTIHNEPGISYSFGTVYVDLCTKLGCKALMANITKSDGVSAEMQIN